MADEIVAALGRKIKLYRENRRVTLKELSEKLNVSMSTISRVINNKPGVNKKTRTFVKNYLEENGLLKNNENNNIVIIIPDFENPYFGEIIKEISRILFINSTDSFGFPNFIWDSRISCISLFKPPLSTIHK